MISKNVIADLRITENCGEMSGSRVHRWRALGILSVGMLMATGVKAAEKPNIVFILVDDLGYGDLGCYGQEKILTPRIDQMAAQGMRFTQAYAGSAVCAPSRCSLLTGMHNGHNRIRDNIPHDVALRPDDVTVAEVLKKAGYRTAVIGKWSLGDTGTWGIPNDQGFDYWYGQLDQDLAINYYPETLWENERMVILQHLTMVNDVGIMVGNRAGARVEYAPDLFVEKARAFIRQNPQHPFFLYLAMTLPHYSEYPPDSPDHFEVPNDKPYSNRDWSQSAKNYAAMVSRIDHSVGEVLDLLREMGIDRNTIVLFSSDNGPYDHPVTQFFKSGGGLRGGKRDLYEGGIRIPMIVRWPGTVAPGQVSDLVWAFWDFLPTAAELAGLPQPDGIDGISVVPTLLGLPNGQKHHEFLYWDYGHVRKTYVQAVRLGNRKGVRNRVDAPIELYDLENDVGETCNVAQKHPDIVEQIARIMATAATNSEDYPILSRGSAKMPPSVD